MNRKCRAPTYLLFRRKALERTWRLSVKPPSGAGLNRTDPTGTLAGIPQRATYAKYVRRRLLLFDDVVTAFALRIERGGMNNQQRGLDGVAQLDQLAR